MQRIIEVETRGTALSVRDGRLSIAAPEKTGKTPLEVPLRDIAVLLLSDSALSLTGAVHEAAADHNFPIVFCGKNHSPAGMFLPIAATEKTSGIMRMQISAPKTTLKRLWKEIIRRKLLNQADVLDHFSTAGGQFLRNLSKKTLSADKTNTEALAASFYWKTLNVFPKRCRTAQDANVLFNYAYMVLLGTAARAICATGLHPVFGLSHHSQYNPFCLASDLIEPFRAGADYIGLNLLNEFTGILTRDLKRKMLEALCSSLSFHQGQVKRKLFEAMMHSAVSLKNNLNGSERRMLLPKFFIDKQ